MTTSIEFDLTYEPIFMQNGLKTFDAFFTYQQGKIINRNEKRDVTILELPAQDGPSIFFMKRFHRPHIKDMLFTFRNFGKFCSQAELEWRNTRTLLDNGIETYHPVCWGTQTCCGIERRSFFITRKIQGRSLIDFLFEHWSIFGQSEKETLVRAIAQFFEKIHRAQLNLPDSYLWHLFVTEPVGPQQEYRFAIIDLHRMQIRAASPQHAARNLGALFFSLPEEWFDDRLRELLINTYLEQAHRDLLASRDSFIDEVKKREKMLTARRRKPTLAHLKKMI